MPSRRIMVIVLLLLGFALRLGPALRCDYWLDEIQNWRNAEAGLADCVFRGNQQDPPLWNVIFWFALQLCRRPWFPRLLAVLAGTWSLWLFWRCGRVDGDPPFVSLLALALLLLNPLHAMLSADVKHYAFSTALFLVHLLALQRLGNTAAGRDGDARRAVVLSTAALAWTNYLGVFQVLVSFAAYASWRGWTALREGEARRLGAIVVWTTLLVLPLVFGVLPRQMQRWRPSSAADWRSPVAEYPLRIFRRVATADRGAIHPVIVLLALAGAARALRRRSFFDRVWLGAWFVHLPVTCLCLARWENLFSMRYFLFEGLALVQFVASGGELLVERLGLRSTAGDGPEDGPATEGDVRARFLRAALCLALAWPLWGLGRGFMVRFLTGHRSEWHPVRPLLAELRRLPGLQSVHVFPYWMDQVVAFACYEIGSLPWRGEEIREILHHCRSLDDPPGDPRWREAVAATGFDELLCMRRSLWDGASSDARRELDASFLRHDFGGDFLLLTRRGDEAQRRRIVGTYPRVPVISRFSTVSVYDGFRLDDFRDFARRLLPGEIVLVKPGHMNEKERKALEEKLVLRRVNPYLLVGTPRGRPEVESLLADLERRYAGRTLVFQP